MSKTKSIKEKRSRTGDDSEFQQEITRIIEGGGYTPEERIKVCLETIDLSLARARQSARLGVASGSCAFAALAERMQIILAGLETRKEMQEVSDRTTTKIIGWEDFVK